MLLKYMIAICVILNVCVVADATIILSDGAQHGIENFSVEEAAKVIGEEVDDGVVDNIIFFIHGRGKHPKKALDKIIPHLQKDYGASVVMFHWFPSFNGPLSRPEKPARNAASDLKKVLHKYKKYKEKNNITIKATLLAHSMGNIVLEEYFKNHHTAGALGQELFDTVILNAADVDRDGHHDWVQKIDFTKNLYITRNKKDSILGLSAKSVGKGRLGQKWTTMFKSKEKLGFAKNAIYLNFSKTGVNHRYYIFGGQKGNRLLHEFYGLVLNGESASEFLQEEVQEGNIKKETFVSKVVDSQITIYHFKKVRN